MPEQLLFSRSLYEPEAVEDAVRAFDALARFEVQLTADDIIVTISEPDAELADVLADELCNHALHQTVIRARG